MIDKNLPATTTSQQEDKETIDYQNLLKQAAKIFASQAGLDGKDKDLTQIETDKARANNLVDAISNALTMSHSLDLLQAEDKRFKRGDELTLLNSLFNTCKVQAHMAHKTTLKSNQFLDQLSADNPEDIIAGQAIMSREADITNKIIHSVEKLISLERHSGGRHYGAREASPNSMMYIKSLELAEEEKSANSKPKGQVRQLTHEEVEKLIES